MRKDEPIERILQEAVERLAAEVGPCPPPESLVAFYEGRLSEPEMELLRDHIAACAACTATAREVRGFLAQPSARAAPARASHRRPLAVAAVFALGALLGLFLSRSWEPSQLSTWQEMLPHILVKKDWAPPVASTALLWRDVEPPQGGPPQDAFAQAMDPYLRGEYAAASAALRGVLQDNPFHEPAALYLGISLLLDHQPEEASVVLEKLAAGAALKETRDEALWYGALSRLEANRPQDARVLLDRLLAQPASSIQHVARFLRTLLPPSPKP